MENLKKNFQLDFAIVGAQKAGTTSASNIFEVHPQIIMPTGEMQFFNQFVEYEKGIDFYEKKYFNKLKKHSRKKLNNKNIIFGEKTPELCCQPDALVRLYKKFPNVKLVMFLRNPIDRVFSHYNMDLQKFGDTWSDKNGKPYEFTDVIKWETNPCHPVNRGKYIVQIKHMIKIVGKENLCISITEKCKLDMFDEYSKIFDFLNLDEISKSDLDLNVLGCRKNWQFKGKYEHKMTQTDWKYLKDLYKPYNEELYNYLGCEIKEWQQ